ncbi:MAG: cation:proton antiporter [Planctomycetota bacterium]
MDAGWYLLTDVLILLAAALVCGTIAERFKQSSIIGYLFAGAVVGPGALGWVGTHGDEAAQGGVNVIAELGVSLLLFTIGLEFSFRRLRKLGAAALGGGTLQLTLTTAAAWPVAMLVGLSPAAAFAVALMVGLSSTACVLALLQANAAGESPHGRMATGMLLLQDVAVLPVTLLVTALAAGGTAGQMLAELGQALLFSVLLVVVFLLLFNVAAPRLLNLKQWARNREFPILLAIVMALGSAALAHEAGISPAIGAFLAGVLLAESPFDVQVRADVASLRTVLVTLFFASIGMLADPVWAVANWHLVIGATAAVLVGKAAIVLGVLSLPIKGIKQSAGVALAAGLCLAQVGEFSFVLAKIAVGDRLGNPDGNGLISGDTFRLIVSVTIVTLLVTPYLVQAAPKVAAKMNRRFWPKGVAFEPAETGPEKLAVISGDRLLLVGFGPAGQQVAAELTSAFDGRGDVIDLNPRVAGLAAEYGMKGHVGDATNGEVLDHVGLRQTQLLIVTLPDPAAAREVIARARAACPSLNIVARSRYHVTRWELMLAGAEVVVDEEEHVGRQLAHEALSILAVEPEVDDEDDT